MTRTSKINRITERQINRIVQRQANSYQDNEGAGARHGLPLECPTENLGGAQDLRGLLDGLDLLRPEALLLLEGLALLEALDLRRRGAMSGDEIIGSYVRTSW